MNSRFPVYQIDFSAVAAGKRVAATKRRIRWRFGFPNYEALAEGRTGTDCRGEEHEVVIIWSVTSGKRQILMDGREVHYSCNRSGVLDHSWSTRGNHVMKTVCHVSPPMSANPGFRQYDLLIDGQSFFNMPKVFELGIKGTGDNRVPFRNDYGEYPPAIAPRAYNAPPPRGPSGPPLRAPQNRDEEDAELQRAIKASLDESKRHLEKQSGADDGSSVPAPEPAPASDLLDFGGGPAAAQAPLLDSAPAATTAPPQQAYGAPPPQGYGAPPPPAPIQATPSYGTSTVATGQSFLALPPSEAAASQPSYGAPTPPAYGAPAPPAPPAYGAPAPPAYGVPAPPPPAYQQPAAPTQSFGAATDPYAGHAVDDPFAPKPPSINDITNDIMSAYTEMPTGGAGVTPGFETPVHPGQPLALDNGPAAHAATNGAGTPSLTMNGLVKTEEEPANEFEAALKKLVNVDRIDEPAEEQLKLTMKKEEDEKARKHKNKSKPLPPAANKIVGSGASLSQIKEVKPETAPKEGIMNAPPQLFHPGAASAGMLVVHGEGPPPLQPQGFGVGYNTPGFAGYAAQPAYGYQQQQPPPPPQQYQYR